SVRSTATKAISADRSMPSKLSRTPRTFLATSTRQRASRAKISRMDAIDREILAHLQNEGRLTVTDLAGRILLSVSRCQRRLRELEADGVVRGYHADVDAEKVGLGFT